MRWLHSQARQRATLDHWPARVKQSMTLLFSRRKEAAGGCQVGIIGVTTLLILSWGARVREGNGADTPEHCSTEGLRWSKMKRGLNAFSMVQIYEGNVSFVRHREENSVGLLSLTLCGGRAPPFCFRTEITALLLAVT
jgi:hypothetical protein